MSMKNWQVAAAAVAASLTIAGAVGFKTPGARADKAEKAVATKDKEFTDELRGIGTRVTIVETNYTNLEKTVSRSEAKLDKILERLPRRSAP